MVPGQKLNGQKIKQKKLSTMVTTLLPGHIKILSWFLTQQYYVVVEMVWIDKDRATQSCLSAWGKATLKNGRQWCQGKIVDEF